MKAAGEVMTVFVCVCVCVCVCECVYACNNKDSCSADDKMFQIV